MIEQLHDIEVKLDFLDSERIAHLTRSLRDNKAEATVVSCQTEPSSEHTEIQCLQELVRELEQAKTSQSLIIGQYERRSEEFINDNKSLTRTISSLKKELDELKSAALKQEKLYNEQQQQFLEQQQLQTEQNKTHLQQQIKQQEIHLQQEYQEQQKQHEHQKEQLILQKQQLTKQQQDDQQLIQQQQKQIKQHAEQNEQLQQQVQLLKQQKADTHTDQKVADLHIQLEAAQKEASHLRNKLEKKGATSDPGQRTSNDTRNQPPPRKPDVLFLHDSLGKGINDSILKNENLITEKALTYKLEDAIQNISQRQTIPHQAVVIHVGTNNIQQQPEHVVTKVEELATLISRKAPNTKIVISSIVGRGDSIQAKTVLDYVNAACRLRMVGKKMVSFAVNDNIDDSCLSSDKIHLKQHGTSRLASNIKKGVAKALSIQLKRKW